MGHHCLVPHVAKALTSCCCIPDVANWAASKAVPGPSGPSGPTQACADPAKRLPISLSISAGFVTLYTLLFGFFWVFQKETFWEMLTPFSEPREIIWPGPGETRKNCFARTGVFTNFFCKGP